MRGPLNHPGLMEPKNTNVVSCLQLIFVTNSSLHILRESPVELKPDAAREQEDSLGVGLGATHTPAPAARLQRAGTTDGSSTVYRKSLTASQDLSLCSNKQA